MPERRRRLLGDINFRKSVGIEVGALHSPIVPRSEGRVIYVDYAATEVLRANLKHPGVDPADLLEVDVIWGEQPLKHTITEPIDYVVASHVIEHVPDIIGWLRELYDVLKPGGIVGLAIPDRRFTFDLYRAESSVAEMVEAHLRQYHRPSMRQIFDAAAFSHNATDAEAWRPCQRGTAGLPREVAERLSEVYQWMEREIAISTRYFDAHCWVFTPASFLDSLEALAHIGCLPYTIEGFYPTEKDSIEFQVRLKTTTNPNDPAIKGSIAAARRELSPDGPSVLLLQARIAALEHRNRELEAALKSRGNG